MDRFRSNKQMANGKWQMGYLLIESMLAITVILVGLLGIFSLLSQSLSLNRVIADRYVASYLAGEGLEVVKNIIDNNVLAGNPWNSGLSAGKYQFDYAADEVGTDCGASCTQDFYFDANKKVYSYTANDQKTNFNRIIFLEPLVDKSGLAQAIKVNSIINWPARGGGRFTINLEDHFYNYR